MPFGCQTPPISSDAAVMSARNTLEFLALAAIWGASFLFMRIAAPVFGPVALMLIRCGVGAITLLVILLYLRKGADLLAAAGRLSLVGVLNSAIPFVLLGYATLSLSAGVTSILNSLAPLWAAAIAFLWLGDRLTRAQIVGLALGAVGVAVLVSGGDEAATALTTASAGDAAATTAPTRSAGDTLLPFAAGILATAFYGFAANYTRRHLSGVHPLATATGSQLSATAFLLIPGILLWPDAVPDQPLPDTGIWVAAIILGVVCTGIAYLLFFRLIANIGATRTIAVTFVIPLFGVGWGYLFLGERIDLATAVGAAVIVLGTALTTGALLGEKREP